MKNMLSRAQTTRKNKILALASGFFAVILISGIVFAAQPQTVGIAGRLINPAGNVLTGSYNFTFNIYNAQTGGTPLWTEVHDGRASALQVSVKNGVWTTVLGNNTSLSLPWDDTYYLELTINNEVLSPRSSFSAIPFVLNNTNTGKYNFTGVVTFNGTNTFSGGLQYTGAPGSINISVNPSNVTAGTLASAITFSGANTHSGIATFSSGLQYTGAPTALNLSIPPSNITAGTLASAITFSGANTHSGSNSFTGAVNTFTSNTAPFISLNITNNTGWSFITVNSSSRILTLDASSGGATGVVDILNITNGNTRVHDVDTVTGRTRIWGANPGVADVFNVSFGNNRALYLDTSGATPAAYFNSSVNISKAVNIANASLFVNDVNTSESAPIYWNTSSVSFFNSTHKPTVQAGLLTSSFTCGGAMTNTTITLGKAFTGTSTYSVTLTAENVSAITPTMFPIEFYTVKNSGSSFNISCLSNVAQTLTSIIVDWMAIGY